LATYPPAPLPLLNNFSIREGDKGDRVTKNKGDEVNK
ncbi:unnamed protein product, partial [marine sediment metagenome]